MRGSTPPPIDFSAYAKEKLVEGTLSVDTEVLIMATD